MKTSGSNILIATALIILGLGFAAAGIYVGETDDAPGAALIGLGLLIASVVSGIKIARRKA